MKNIFTALAVSVGLIANANAYQLESPETVLGTFDVGAKMGYTRAFEDSSAYLNEGDKNAFNGGIYGEFNVTQHFTLGLAYNLFSGIGVESKAGRDCDLFIQGPELYAKGNYPINDKVELFGRFGVFYAMTDGSHEAEDSKQFSPVVGFGAEYKVYENLSVRAGVDYYHDVYQHADIDMTNFYVGLTYQI